MARSFHYGLGEAIALNNLGLVAQDKGEAELAQQLFQRGLQWGQDNQSPLVMARSQQGMGRLLVEQGETAEGLAYLRDGLATAAGANAFRWRWKLRWTWWFNCLRRSRTGRGCGCWR